MYTGTKLKMKPGVASNFYQIFQVQISNKLVSTVKDFEISKILNFKKKIV